MQYPKERRVYLGWKNFLFYGLFERSRSLPCIGNKDAAWSVDLSAIGENSTVISAGAGKDISFELSLANINNAKILLLDPSPTGIETANAPLNKHPNIEFLPLGLAGRDGELNFSDPENAKEGSFKIAASSESTHKWPCRSLSSLVSERKLTSISLLKIDIEGFEFEVLNDLVKNRLNIAQICVEFHIGRSFPYTRWDLFKTIARLKRSGYQLVHHQGADHTFCK